MNRTILVAAAALLGACTSSPSPVEPVAVAPVSALPDVSGPDAEFAKAVLKASIAVPTVKGRGRVPDLAAYYADVLMASGFDAADIEITPMGETATFTATLQGREDGKPTLLIGHMDVVEANPADWERDPFTPIEEDGFIFGRGSLDNKFGVSMLVTVMAKLKRQGYVPKNDIILAFTGDEETGQLTARALAEKYKDAALVLNSDAGGGGLDEDGVARFYFLQAAEKTYVDFKLEFTNPGGHSSAPRPDNAIYQLAAALSKVGAHNFTPVRSELTDASLGAVVDGVEPEIGAAIKAFLADPNDPSALAVLRANPEYVGQIATTCVSTMITAGHAPNALPQRATANINCRIFPGTSIEAVQAELLTVIGDPAASLTIDGDPHAAPASPLREDVFAAVTAAVNARYPGIPVIPDMSAGATDGAFYRSKGIPSYGVGGVFMKSSDIFAHGLNERSPVDAIPGAITQWESVIHALCD